MPETIWAGWEVMGLGAGAEMKMTGFWIWEGILFSIPSSTPKTWARTAALARSSFSSMVARSMGAPEGEASWEEMERPEDLS